MAVSYTHLDVYKRQGYDVFPDVNRTQPFGSGATCYYPHGDLMLRNDTSDDFQLVIAVSYTHLDVYKRQNMWSCCAGSLRLRQSWQMSWG